MPVIPLPQGGQQGLGGQQARSIPELSVRATPDAFGANIAEENYRGNMQMIGNIAQAAKAETNMYSTAINGVVKVAGEVWQADQRLDAEAKLHDLSLGVQRETEGLEANGDGSVRTRTLASFDQNSQGLLDNASSPYQSRILREGVQRLRFQEERRAVSAEVAGLRQSRLDQLARVGEGAELEVFRDPAQLGAVRERTLATITAANLSPAQRSRALQDMDRRLHAIAIEKYLVNNDAAGAQRMLAQDQTITALGALDSVRMQARVQQQVEQQAERARAIDAQRRLLDGTELIDPANADHRRTVNDAFIASGTDRALTAMDQNAVIQTAAIARRYGVVPQAALGHLQGMAANGTAEEKIFALQAVSAIEQARPGVFEQTPLHRTLRAESEDFRWMVTGETGLGLDPATALQRIEERRSPEFAARAEGRRTALQGRTGLTQNRTEAELQSLFGSDERAGWFSNPGLNNPRDNGQILATYRRAFEEHYLRTGDEAMAVSAAKRDVQRSYAVSRMSGNAPRVVRNPIETQYTPVDGSHEWIRTQALAEILTATGNTVKPEDLYFESTRATAEAISRGGLREGHPPPYIVYWRQRDARGNESWQTIPGRLFVPDYMAAQGAAAQEAIRQRGLRSQPGADAPHNLIRRAMGFDPIPEGGAVVEPRATAVPKKDDPRPEPLPAVRGTDGTLTPAPETLGGRRGRRRRVSENDAQDIRDLLGFAARSQA